ncbi:MAG: twin-arginine translocation signal domain-containing protein, partial [Planctomycetes bacterium]|nr:twin-arginine translocation signal domain-containing protein [Planctomycetota bacterium]
MNAQLSRREFLKAIGAGALLHGCLGTTRAARSSGKRPNIVL